MTSSSSTTEMKDVRSDSALGGHTRATRTLLQSTEEILAKLQKAIDCLTLCSFKSRKPVPIPETKDEESQEYTSEFEHYCIEKKIDEFYPPNQGPFKVFLKEKEKELEPCSEDPDDYPGIQHAASLFLRDSEVADGDIFGGLDIHDQVMLESGLNSKYASELAMNRFGTGKRIGNGEAGKVWLLISQLYNISGSFNCGVHLVKEAEDSDSPTRIMKTLPSPACYPGFADREIDILGTLKYENIIKFFDGGAPKGRHETGWMVTENCDKGTLDDLIEKYIDAKTSIPELFVWQIFESLLRAVVYLHYGPKLLKRFDRQEPGSRRLDFEEDPSWDPVYHRDIILSNVFCTSSTGNKSKYPIVKLGDFGCAMRKSEVETKDEDEYSWSDETPVMDAEYEPPEGQLATKAIDVYQIGLSMRCIVQNVQCPSLLDEQAMPSEDFEAPSTGHYSKELRKMLYRCTETQPGNRIDSFRLLHLIRFTRKRLVFENRLPFIELLP